jgi:peroxiredoxin
MRNLFALAALLIFSTGVPAQNSTLPTDFTAVAMDGSRVDTTELRGKVVVLNLWFINCMNCIEEIKMLNKVVDEYNGKDVVFIGLAASKKADLLKFLVKNPFKYRIVPDAGDIILGKFATPDKDGGVTMPFPMHFVLDKTGKVTVKAQGIKGLEVVKTELRNQFAAKPSRTKQ